MGCVGVSGHRVSVLAPQDLRDRLADAERQLQDGDYDRDKEMKDLRKKLSEARAQARESDAVKQREIKVREGKVRGGGKV